MTAHDMLPQGDDRYYELLQRPLDLADVLPIHVAPVASYSQYDTDNPIVISGLPLPTEVAARQQEVSSVSFVFSASEETHGYTQSELLVGFIDDSSLSIAIPIAAEGQATYSFLKSPDDADLPYTGTIDPDTMAAMISHCVAAPTYVEPPDYSTLDSETKVLEVQDMLAKLDFVDHTRFEVYEVDGYEVTIKTHDGTTEQVSVNLPCVDKEGYTITFEQRRLPYGATQELYLGEPDDPHKPPLANADREAYQATVDGLIERISPDMCFLDDVGAHEQSAVVFPTA